MALACVCACVCVRVCVCLFVVFSKADFSIVAKNKIVDVNDANRSKKQFLGDGVIPLCDYLYPLRRVVVPLFQASACYWVMNEQLR